MRLIDADAFLASQIKSCHCVPLLYDGNENHSWEDLKQALNNAPTIDAEPIRHGYWIEEPLQKYPNEHIDICSECESKSLAKYSYCPNCGAKMDTNKIIKLDK